MQLKGEASANAVAFGAVGENVEVRFADGPNAASAFVALYSCIAIDQPNLFHAIDDGSIDNVFKKRPPLTLIIEGSMSRHHKDG